jgi:hypothetical protein
MVITEKNSHNPNSFIKFSPYILRVPSCQGKKAKNYCSASNHSRSGRSVRRQRQAGEILAGQQCLAEPGAEPFSLLKLLLGMTVFGIPSPQ